LSDPLWEWAGEHEGISVRVAQPIFPVAVFAEMAFLQSLHFEVYSATHGSVEVFELEPQQDAIAVRAKRWIPQRTVLVLRIPAMQLQNQLPVGYKTFILITAVSAGAPKDLPVPIATGLNVVNADEGCQLHVIGSYLL
jgi:hypothetical protein